MFKKKPSIKPLSPLRSSDRRRIADRIIAEYGIEISSKDAEEQPVNSYDIPTIGVGAVRNALLPENSQSARFTTTVGKDLKQASVYSLWRNPGIVPLLHTPDVVLQKLRGGADLMTPGLARGPPFPAKAREDSTVAIASLEKPDVPMVVGVCEIDVGSLGDVRGSKGHAVRGEHWHGDEVWAWSQSGSGGGKAPDEIPQWDSRADTGGLEDNMQSMNIEDSDHEDDGGGIPISSPSNGIHHEDRRNNFVEGEEGKPWEEVHVEEQEFSTKEIDTIFWNAFLYALHHHRNTNRSDAHHGLSFPISQSNVISNLVLPFLPITTPTQAASLNIKKTSWKNAKKFIKALDKAKLLKSKDRDGGECVVLDVDFEDPAVTAFVPYKLPKKDTPGAESGGGGGGKAISVGGSPADDSIGQKLKKIDLYRPKEQLAPIFTAANTNHHALYLASELRPIINSYIESEGLISGTNKRLINLNPTLANAVFDGSTPLDKEVLAKGSVPRDALIDRIIENCTPFWALLRNDETRDEVKAKAGHTPKIQIVLETRSGNKTVTKLSGVETFHIHPQLLAEELQKACASSTSVSQLAGSSPKKPVMEVMVQGPQKEIMVKALEKRGVHRQWIEFNDKTKKGKKR
ncbi:MAG: hypothetical protein Q9222_007197 [Ikaeria aurantiellina]